MICHTCHHRATKISAGFILWGCRKHKLNFGTTADWKAGKWLGDPTDKREQDISDMPIKCKDAVK